MSAPPLRWGILGTGWIAERFVQSVTRHTRQEFVAVGSRDARRAKEFASAHNVRRFYGAYEDLVAASDVDIVYVATVHNAHWPCARLALEAGKHVLVEKPLALNAAQASQMAQLAAETGRFCGEALWTYFLPKFDVVRQLLDAGALGEIRTVIADFGAHFSLDHRIMRQDLAGGPLLDLGTYPISLAKWVLGPLDCAAAVGQPHEAGVNGQLAAILCDNNGNEALVHTTICSDTPTQATIGGALATLTISGPFYTPGEFVVTSNDGSTPLVFSEERVAHSALYFEAAAAARSVSSGETQFSNWTLDDSIETLRIMDAIRSRCGISFAGEGTGPN
ncbi:MAG TPA: Gfo/Idh/MocA family oxidoreductase [Acidimicrobiales bacterium]|nr:Gfo/Idh/MocA family oxidoreductase [Acidimicrobiales bacterium]